MLLTLETLYIVTTAKKGKDSLANRSNTREPRGLC